VPLALARGSQRRAPGRGGCHHSVPPRRRPPAADCRSTSRPARPAWHHDPYRYAGAVEPGADVRGEQQRGGNHYVDIELSSPPTSTPRVCLRDDYYMDSPGLASAFLTVYAVAHFAAKPAQNAPKGCVTLCRKLLICIRWGYYPADFKTAAFTRVPTRASDLPCQIVEKRAVTSDDNVYTSPL
jgi:hypothetical protein